MPIPVDSFKVLKQSYDSLQRAIEVHSSYFKPEEPPVQAAFIIAITTIITVILGFVFKDYWIPGWIENRVRKKQGKELFKFYKGNLFNSAKSFSHRLHEIFRTRSHYLLSSQRHIEFYDYKYKSSVYRLCVLLGWIKIYKNDLSNISLNKESEIYKLDAAIDAFSSALADGQNVEMYIAKSVWEICHCGKADETKLTNLSVAIDHLVNEYIARYSIDYVSTLSDDNQKLFITDLTRTMKDIGIQPSVDLLSIQSELIKATSVKLGLIYRDWQSAIGELMIESKEIKGIVKYNIISYKKFEEYWSKNDVEKIWLNRCEKIFNELDITKDKTSDSRILQLKRIYEECYKLIKVLFDIEIGHKPITKKQFSNIPKELTI